MNPLPKKPRAGGEEAKEKLEEKLSEIKIKKEEEEASRRAVRAGLAYINLKGFPISPEALRLISPDDALDHKIICFYTTETSAKLASTAPENLSEFRKQFEETHDLKTELYLISAHSYEIAYKFYATLPKIYKLAKGVEITEEDLNRLKEKVKTFQDLNREIQKVSITDLVTMVVASAVTSRASDIHIEAEEKDIKVRFRIDGVLIDVAEIDKKFWEKVISRIKILSSLKINIIDRPQDGRFTIHLTREKIDVRVSCLPTAYGESVVMRLLRAAFGGLEFEALGIASHAFDKLKKEVERPNGMILTTGPTGSGKTTTLYSILTKLNKPETKIITLENPIEYELKGISQSQIDPSKDYTFAKGLRSILRQDPDVVMVGEIRDTETAEIAVQAALTGHLVISTLHTNDASGAIPRLLSMGAKPYLLAPAINAVIGQRLVRRICEKCREEDRLEPEVLKRVKKVLSEIPKASGVKVDLDKLKFYKGKGCEACQGLGYHGRVGIYEIFTIVGEIEKTISQGETSEYKMKELAKKQGMITMVQDGLLKALEGVTTVKEVFRVTE